MRGAEFRVPGDKSISHRALMLAGLMPGTSRIRGCSTGLDVQSTAAALRKVGLAIPPLSDDLEIRPARLRSATGELDCGNSGTTARLLLGLLGGVGVGARLNGDGSLRQRPMDRVTYPLQAMGVRLSYAERRDRLPIELHPRATGQLRELIHRPRVASAQIKSALLLAGLASGVRVVVREPGRSRDHTERMLAALGTRLARADAADGVVEVELPANAREDLGSGVEIEVPGDPSSAAFLLGAATLMGRPLKIGGVSANPTRVGFFGVLERMGLPVELRREGASCGEPYGRITLAEFHGRPAAFVIGGGEIPTLLDEVPLLAVLAARARGTSRISGAAELRVKESDRLALLARNLARIGVSCTEMPDGLEITGTPDALAGRIETGGDHRIAMAFAVLSSAPGAELELDDRDCAAVSYPGFWSDLGTVSA